MLAEACAIATGIDGLRAKVRGLLHGLEAEISLVLDVMLPASRVVDALKAFRLEFPTVSLRPITRWRKAAATRRATDAITSSWC